MNICDLTYTDIVACISTKYPTLPCECHPDYPMLHINGIRVMWPEGKFCHIRYEDGERATWRKNRFSNVEALIQETCWLENLRVVAYKAGVITNHHSLLWTLYERSRKV